MALCEILIMVHYPYVCIELNQDTNANHFLGLLYTSLSTSTYTSPIWLMTPGLLPYNPWVYESPVAPVRSDDVTIQ